MRIEIVCRSLDVPQFKALGFIEDEGDRSGHVCRLINESCDSKVQLGVFAMSGKSFYGCFGPSEKVGPMLIAANDGKVVAVLCSWARTVPVATVGEDGQLIGVDGAIQYWSLLAEVKGVFRRDALGFSVRVPKAPNGTAEKLAKAADVVVASVGELRGRLDKKVRSIVNKLK